MEELVVRLRPFEEVDLVCFDRFANDPLYSPFEWTGFLSAQSWRRMWAEHRLLGGPYCLVVADVADDSFVGWVDWRQNDRPGPGVWEFGALIDPQHRRRGARHSVATSAGRRPHATACGRVPPSTTSPSRDRLSASGCNVKGVSAEPVSGMVNGATTTSTAWFAATGNSSANGKLSAKRQYVLGPVCVHCRCSNGGLGCRHRGAAPALLGRSLGTERLGL
jgi:hypothetical protein